MRCFQCHVHLHFGPLLSFWTFGSMTVFGCLRAVLPLGCLGLFLIFECFRSFFVSIGIWISLFGRVCKQPTLSGTPISAFLRRLHWQLTYHRVRKCCAVFLDVSQENGSNSAPHVNDQMKVNTVQNSCQKCVLLPRGITMSVAWLSQLLVQPSHRASWPAMSPGSIFHRNSGERFPAHLVTMAAPEALHLKLCQRSLVTMPAVLKSRETFRTLEKRCLVHSIRIEIQGVPMQYMKDFRLPLEL